MAVVSISVRTVQQALTFAHHDTPVVPSPGTIDGVWGSRTRASLDIYRSLIRARSPLEVQLGTIPDRVVSIPIEDWVARYLQVDARSYTSLPPGAAVPQEIANRVSTMSQETATSLPFPAAAIVAPVGRATSSWLPLVLGLGAAVVLVGGGYWLYTRSRGRRRRR
jgi:hypothetical protein